MKSKINKLLEEISIKRQELWEEYEKLKEVRANWHEFKGNLRDGVENTQNPMV